MYYPLKLTLIILTFFLAIQVRAQTNDKEIIKEFFEVFENDPIQALEYAFSTNPWMARNVDGVESVKNKFADLLPLIGDYYGWETITEKKIGENYKLVSYMVRYDRQPLRLTFIFYKPNDKWQVQNLQYDDNLDDELEEAAKQN